MIRPVYRYWLGKMLPNFSRALENTSINTKGEETTLAGWQTTMFLRVDGSKYLYIDIDTPDRADIVHVHCYSHTGYLGSKAVGLDKTIEVPSGIESIRITYADTLAAVIQDIAAKSKFVYSLQECKPHYKSLKKKYAKENLQEFFRTSLDGKVTFFDNDFTYISNASLNDTLVFIIEKYNTEYSRDEERPIWDEYSKSQFNKMDCKIDFAYRKVEPKFSAIDSYSNVMDKYEEAYDLIKLAPALTPVALNTRMLIQIYIRDTESVSNFIGGTYWDTEVEAKYDTIYLYNTCHFSTFAHGTEIEITGSNIADVNGTYAGLGKTATWINNKGYTMYLSDMSDMPTGPLAFIYIRRDSDNAVLYRSTKRIAIYDKTDPWFDTAFTLTPINASAVGNLNVMAPIHYEFMGRIITNAESITDAEGTKQTYELDVQDFAMPKGNYRRVVALGSATVYCTSAAVDEPTKYGMNDDRKYFTNRFISPSLGIPYRPLPVCRATWTNASLWYVYSDGYKTLEERARTQYVIDDCFGIGDVIAALLKKIDPAIKHEPTAEYSQFLYGDGGNVRTADFRVVITPKSNIIKGQYGQPAQKAKTSLKDIMDMLSDCFRCYWWIENGKFRIEHVSYFANGDSYSSGAQSIGLDLTNQKDQMNGMPALCYQNAVEYEKSDLNSSYTFEWMDEVTDLFYIKLDVMSAYVQKDKTEDITIKNFTPDIDYMLLNPDEVSMDGFALLCPILKNNAHIMPVIEAQFVDDDGIEYTAYVQNYYASWPHLISYYAYDLSGSTVTVDKMQSLNIKSIKQSMTQSVEAFCENDLDLLGLVNTNLGGGRIKEMSVNIDTRKADITLQFTPR